MEEAYQLYRDSGVYALKVGFVSLGQAIERRDQSGSLLGMEWHHGQWMVRFYRKVIEPAASYNFVLCIHEPIKDTGERRTYPNMFTREGGRGQEYNAWDRGGGNPPDHTVILPFTRLLAGPMDYTPGIVDLLHEPYNTWARVNHTLAKELALYVVIHSPLQMAADLIENYEGEPAFQFILDVPVDWQETRVLNGEIGEYFTVARKDRNSDEWYIGSITNERGRTLEAGLGFLDPGTPNVAEIYADAGNADWESNPQAMDIRQASVDADTTLSLVLAPGGGQAIRIYPAS